MANLANRKDKFIKNLESALIRIQNKTYGICRVTGKLIQKQRHSVNMHQCIDLLVGSNFFENIFDDTV